MRFVPRFAVVPVIAAALAFTPALLAQQSTQIAPASAANSTATDAQYTNDQLIPLTVHQAWLLSGKNEANFFTMVTQLAELSAQNRNLALPNTAAAGQRVGQMIKVAAKADTDQLLFAVVDQAVRKVGKPLPVPAGQ